MSKRTLSLLVMLLPLLAFAAVPAARAGCADDPDPGVNWDTCNMDGEDFDNEDLTNGVLTNGSYIGTTFVDATLNNVSFANSDLTNANIGASVGGTINTLNLQGATIEGLAMSGRIIIAADLNGAEGIPDTTNIVLMTGTCPDGNSMAGTSPWCSWQPLAVTLEGAGAAAAPSVWPFALTALMLAVTAAVVITRSRKVAL